MKPKRPRPFFISKTINVFIVPPYNLVVEYETGEKRMLDLEEWIDKDPELHILKENTELFYSPSVSLCGYMTVWESDGICVHFHNDIVYVYGDDVEIESEDQEDEHTDEEGEQENWEQTTTF